MQNLSWLIICLFTVSLWGCPNPEPQEDPAPPKTETKEGETDSDAPQGPPPDQHTMLLASFTGCFEKREENEDAVSRTTLKITLDNAKQLTELETFEVLEAGHDNPSITQETSTLIVQELEETLLVFERRLAGQTEGTRGVYSWVDGQFYVTDSRGHRVGPFESCQTTP